MENNKRVSSGFDFAGEKILVVDDEKNIVEMLRDALSGESLQVETCLDAESAFPKLKEEDFDVVMTDIRLPGVSGLELLKHIKELSPRTEVIIFTGYATIETAIKASDCGAMCYLTKPFKLQTVKEKIREAVERQRKFATLVKSEKLSTLEQVVGVIRHEIINETQAILGCVEYFIARKDERFLEATIEDSIVILDEIKTSVFRVNNIVNQLEKIRTEIRTTRYVGDTEIIDLEESS